MEEINSTSAIINTSLKYIDLLIILTCAKLIIIADILAKFEEYLITALSKVPEFNHFETSAIKINSCFLVEHYENSCC